ncbi:MAG: phosphate/phosphite/phosphonate ABC transporter substrate-binding protein [Pseudomonadota bacterium]
MRSWTLVPALAALLAGCRPEPEVPGPPSPPSSPARPVKASEWPNQIQFGITPVLDLESLRRGNQALCDELGHLLGTEVKLVVSSNYGELGELLIQGQVTFARMSPLAYVVARTQYPSLRLVASMIADGSIDYAAYIVARADSDILRVDDLRGRSFGFVDVTSGSGYLYPLVYIWDRFGKPERFFSGVRFLGNHQALLRAVEEGHVDAGATFSAALVTYGQMGLGSPFRIVAKTGRIPYDAFVAGPALDDAQVAALQSALLGIDTRSPRGRKVLGPLRHINGFLPANDALYDTVRTVVTRATMHGTHVGPDQVSNDAGP